jgi:hypothetical protein
MTVVDGPPALAALSGGAEVFWSACTLRQAAQPDRSPDAHEDTRSLTVLVCLSPDAADRAVTDTLHCALSFAECESAVYAGTDWPQQLGKRLSALRPDSVAAAVYVSAKTLQVAEAVQAAVDALRQTFGSALSALVVISDAGEQLVDVRGISGFIQGVQVTDGDTARALFLVLAMLMAPRTLNCYDVNDLLPMLGPAQAATVLAQGIWFREGHGRLEYASGADRLAVTAADRVLAIPFLSLPRLREIGQFHAAVRADALASSQQEVFAPESPLQPLPSPTKAGWVLIMCGGCR